MNLGHEFYDLQDLEKRWSEYGLTEKDILKHGVSGKLQFSFRIPSGSDTFIHIYAIGNLSDGEVFICDEIAPDCRGSIYNISTVTINDLFEAESNYIKNGIPSTVDFNLEIPCPNHKCKFPDRATNCNIVYSNFPLMGPDDGSYSNFTGNRSDLIVTHENVLAFEKNHLKTEEQTLPYLDPSHDGYNSELAEFPPSTPDSIPQNNQARPSFNKEKIPDQDGSITLLFYKRESDGHWIVGAEDDFSDHENIEGFEMLQQLIRTKNENISCNILEKKDATHASKLIEAPEDYAERKKKQQSHYAKESKDDLVKELYMQDKYLEIINEELSITIDPERKYDLKKILPIIKKEKTDVAK